MDIGRWLFAKYELRNSYGGFEKGELCNVVHFLDSTVMFEKARWYRAELPIEKIYDLFNLGPHLDFTDTHQYSVSAISQGIAANKWLFDLDEPVEIIATGEYPVKRDEPANVFPLIKL